MKPIENAQARFKYHLEEFFTAGLILEGWEVKAIRAGKVQMTDGYLVIKDGEIFTSGLRIDPIPATFAAFSQPFAYRSRKLLLKKTEIKRLMGKVHEKGMALVPVKLFMVKNRVKLEIALAKGKNDADKRDTIKEREWKREQGRIMKGNRL